MLPILSDDSTSYSLLRALQDLQLLAKRNFSSNRIFVPFLFILSSLAEAGALEELSLEESGEGEKCVKSGLAIAVNSIAKMKAAPRVAASSKVCVLLFFTHSNRACGADWNEAENAGSLLSSLFPQSRISQLKSCLCSFCII